MFMMKTGLPVLYYKRSRFQTQKRDDGGTKMVFDVQL